MALGVLTACTDRTESLAGFEAAYEQALQQGRTDKLYLLLDSNSRRRVDTMLDTARGFDSEVQARILKQLGASETVSLDQMQPPEFFALWWDSILQSKRPSVAIAESNGDATIAAWLVLKVDDREQRMALIQETGRWAWRLPESAKLLPNR